MSDLKDDSSTGIRTVTVTDEQGTTRQLRISEELYQQILQSEPTSFSIRPMSDKEEYLDTYVPAGAPRPARHLVNPPITGYPGIDDPRMNPTSPLFKWDYLRHAQMCLSGAPGTDNENLMEVFIKRQIAQDRYRIWMELNIKHDRIIPLGTDEIEDLWSRSAEQRYLCELTADKKICISNCRNPEQTPFQFPDNGLPVCNNWYILDACLRTHLEERDRLAYWLEIHQSLPTKEEYHALLRTCLYPVDICVNLFPELLAWIQEGVKLQIPTQS